LSNHEKANLRRSGAELTMFGILAGLISLIGPEKDKKGMWADRMALYQLKRLYLETGASIPIPTTFIKNMFAIL